MEQVIEYIVKNLVKSPKDVKITKTETETETIIEIFVHEEDKGRVIGKEGKLINSIRTIAKSIVDKSDKKINIKIGE